MISMIVMHKFQTELNFPKWFLFAMSNRKRRQKSNCCKDMITHWTLPLYKKNTFSKHVLENLHLVQGCKTNVSSYSRMNEVKFVEHSLWNIWSDMVCFISLSTFELTIRNSQFAKRFGSLRMSFCIFSKDYETLKSDNSWIFRVIHWTSNISYFILSLLSTPCR